MKLFVVAILLEIAWVPRLEAWCCGVPCCGIFSVATCLGIECNVFCCNCNNHKLCLMPEWGLRLQSAAQPGYKFAEFDENSDGQIDRNEFLIALGDYNETLEAKHPKWFESMDKNGDGWIQPSEFDSSLE
ncbi:unnamed protein product, partial [Mesorhabditis belari]|uniref:EF-hand domain-containing protein n=1 Tax=Mesorhabditis belari TaxID=2138241 RepID=A0AAF3F0B4_9BILA